MRFWAAYASLTVKSGTEDESGNASSTDENTSKEQGPEGFHKFPTCHILVGELSPQKTSPYIEFGSFPHALKSTTVEATVSECMTDGEDYTCRYPYAMIHL